MHICKTLRPQLHGLRPCSTHDDQPGGVHNLAIGVANDQGLHVPQGWCSASALLGLDSAQFLNLQVPTIADPAQLSALRSQVISASDRLQLLSCQGDLWADDELRFHLHAISSAYVQHCAKIGHTAGSSLLVIDPLITAAWGAASCFCVCKSGLDLILRSCVTGCKSLEFFGSTIIGFLCNLSPMDIT